LQVTQGWQEGQISSIAWTFYDALKLLDQFMPLDPVTFNRQNLAMQNTNAAITRPLAFAGALPFVFCALLLWAGHRALPVLGSVQNIAASYGLLILAFMAGVHWGQRLSGVDTKLNLFLLSNGLALAGWFAYLLLSPRLFFASLAVLFAVVLMVDRWLGAEGHISTDYVRTRTAVSALVVLSLAVIALKV
jgi:hypothetical protein